MQSPAMPAVTSPLAVRPKQAAEMVGLSLSQIWREIDAGRLRTAKAGSARLVPVDALREWLAARAAK
jgi:excisionase family DNA binding protein